MCCQLTFLRSSGSNIGSKQTHIAAQNVVSKRPYTIVASVRSFQIGTESVFSSFSRPTVKKTAWRQSGVLVEKHYRVWRFLLINSLQQTPFGQPYHFECHPMEYISRFGVGLG